MAFLMTTPKTILGVSKSSIEAVVESEIASCPPDPSFGQPDRDFRWYLSCFRWQFLIESARAYREKFDRCEKQYSSKEIMLFGKLKSIANSKFKITKIEQNVYENVCQLLLEICKAVNPKFTYVINFIGDDMSDVNYVIYRNEKSFFSTKQILRGVVRLSEIDSIYTDNGCDFVIETKSGYVSLNLYDY